MSKEKERYQFRRAMVAEFGDTPEVEKVRDLLLRHAKTHQNYSVFLCNVGNNDRVEKRIENLRRRMVEIATVIGAKLNLGGDPRGYTVKVLMPKTRAYNTWGGAEEGYGVPTS